MKNITLFYLPLSFNIAFSSPIELYSFFGSTLRGGLGFMIKRFVCVRRDGLCEKCALRANCLYSKLFEPTILNFDSPFKGIQDLPRPFVISVDDTKNEISQLEFNLTLFGEAANNMHYFIQAFIELGERGISREKLQFKVNSVTSNGRIVYKNGDDSIPSSKTLIRKCSEISLQETKETLTIEFLSPVRLKEKGSYCWSGEFGVLFRSLLRRITLLEALYCSGSSERNIKEIIALADEVKLENMSRRFRDQRRFSKRKNKVTLHGGYLGTFSYSNIDAELIPYLHIGSIIHVGHNATFGLGRYIIK